MLAARVAEGMRREPSKRPIALEIRPGIAPQSCIMVGDRIDNDVSPAKLIGMRTMLFRTGRHIEQQPRSAVEVPDVEVWDVTGLKAALSTSALGSHKGEPRVPPDLSDDYLA